MNIDFFKSEREKLIKQLRKWGSSTADAAVDPRCRHFAQDGIEGFIPYRLESNFVVVFGDPVCSALEMPRLVKSFHEYCRKNKNNIAYIITTKKFACWAINNSCSSLLEFGQELYLNPTLDDPQKGPLGALLRKKIRRAVREGVKVEEYLSFDELFEKNIEEMAGAWIKGRSGPQVYISKMCLFQDRFGRRWFYGKKDGEIVGLALLNQLEERGGWVLSQIILSPNAPVGTSELLVSQVIETLAKEKVAYISFGAVPAKELGDIQGLSKISSGLIRFLFKVCRKLFHFDGKKIFWQKFQPKTEPSYVLFSSTSIKIKDIAGIIKAANMSL